MTPEEKQKLAMVEKMDRRNARRTATKDPGTATESAGSETPLTGVPTPEEAVAGEGVDAWGTSGPAISGGGGEGRTLGAELAAVSAAILAGSGSGGTVFGASMPQADGGSASDGTAAVRPTTAAPATIEGFSPGVFTAGNVGLVGFPAALARELSGLGESGR